MAAFTFDVNRKLKLTEVCLICIKEIKMYF